jgi:hypothetical protein
MDILRKDSVGCCWNHCNIAALTSSSNPTRILGLLARSWGFWTCVIHAVTSPGCMGGDRAPSRAWNAALPGQCGNMGRALSCNTMKPLVSHPWDASCWWRYWGLGRFYSSAMRWWWCHCPWMPASEARWCRRKQHSPLQSVAKILPLPGSAVNVTAMVSHRMTSICSAP